MKNVRNFYYRLICACLVLAVIGSNTLVFASSPDDIVFSDCIIEPQNRIENQKILKGEFYETVKAEYSSISSDIAIEDRCGDEIFLDLGILQNQCQ